MEQDKLTSLVNLKDDVILVDLKISCPHCGSYNLIGTTEQKIDITKILIESVCSACTKNVKVSERKNAEISGS